MKTHISIVVIFVLLGYSYAERSAESSKNSEDEHELSNFEVDESMAGMSAMLVGRAITEDLNRDKSVITAIVDEYMDRLFEKVHNFAVKTGLDPTPLQNFSQRFLTEHVTLNHGLLHGISTLKRDKSVELSYSHDKRILKVQFPVVFSNLSFTYDYELQLLLLKHTGGMTGLVKDFTMDIVLQFDFNTYKAALLKSSVLRTGSITLTFQRDIIDIVINILSNFVTLILKPVLVLAIQGIVAAVGGKIVNVVNHVIDHILHPNATQVAYGVEALLL